MLGWSGVRAEESLTVDLGDLLSLVTSKDGEDCLYLSLKRVSIAPHLGDDSVAKVKRRRIHDARALTF